MNLPEWDSLDSLLNEWQPPTPLPGAAGVDAERTLCQRVQERVRASRVWRSVVAAGAAAAVLAGLVYLGPLTPAPAARTVEQIAVMQDMQLLSRNADLIEHLDFLMLPASSATEASQPE
ncbi:MAG: hypothetical protein EPN33_13395 [Acidobacteria bacterium]|nr:MAG: hypothetical protein EPN33_13395 [Acidobacteriota bacterium]